jgi:O-antigen ligase
LFQFIVLARSKVLYKKLIVNKKIINSFLEKTLSILVLVFPLIIVFRSAAINLTTTLVSVIVLFYIFKKNQIDIFKNKLVIYIIIFFLFIFINSIIHFTTLDLILNSLGNFRYILLAISVPLVLDMISDKKKIFFIYFNLIIIFLIALDILYQFLFYKDIFGFAPGMCTDILKTKCQRFSGVFGEELIAGSYLSQIGFLVLILFLNLDLKKNYYHFSVKIFLSLFLLSVVIITGERAPLLIIVFTLFFIFFFKKKIIYFFLFVIFLFTIIFFAAQKIESINSRFVNLFDGWGSSSKNLSIVNKIIESPWSFHYQAAIELFIEKPILGHGPKSFRIKCEHTKIDKKTKENRDYYRDYRACSTHPHNYLLEFLSEHGLVGCIFFIGLIFFIFISIYKLHKNNKNTTTVIAIGSLIISIIFPIKPSGSFFTTINASMLFYVLGFFFYYLKKNK